MKYFWFSRHTPTESQIKELGDVDMTFAELAKQSLDSVEEGKKVLEAMLKHPKLGTWYRRGWPIFSLGLVGVFPTALRAAIQDHNSSFQPIHGKTNTVIYLYESLNIKRTKEGGTPTFEHAGFLLTGTISSYLGMAPLEYGEQEAK